MRVPWACSLTPKVGLHSRSKTVGSADQICSLKCRCKSSTSRTASHWGAVWIKCRLLDLSTFDAKLVVQRCRVQPKAGRLPKRTQTNLCFTAHQTITTGYLSVRSPKPQAPRRCISTWSPQTMSGTCKSCSRGPNLMPFVALGMSHMKGSSSINLRWKTPLSRGRV